MELKTYLKQFNNLLWYPSSAKDFMAMVCLAKRRLMEFGINKNDTPDCFIYTDYLSHGRDNDNHNFFLQLEDFETEVHIYDERYEATIYNIQELNRLRIGFNQEMVAFEADENYGRVFAADVLIRTNNEEFNVVKLVYVIVENTKFAFDYLIPNKIKLKYAVHNCYGHNFGNGISNGAYMPFILKDLGVKYFVSDLTLNHNYDVADIYLSKEQKGYVPVVREIVNLSHVFTWAGYDETILYEVVDYVRPGLGFFNGRFRLV